MNWLRNNLVGLLSVLFLMGSSLVTLYIKAEVNKSAIIQLDKTVTMLSTNQANQTSSLQGYLVRTTQLEGQIARFAKTNDRLIVALDKLDVLYGSLKVTDALQDERLAQLVTKIASIENKMEKHINED